MADPVIIGAVISGLVTLMKYGFDYDLKKKEAEKQGKTV
jgi:hypothetical protein